MKRLQRAPIFALIMLVLFIEEAHPQSATSGANLTPDAPAAVIISPNAMDMISIPAPGTPAFSADTSRSVAAPASPGASGAASGTATGGNSPLNPDCAIAGSDDPANLSFDTVGCGQ